MNNHAVFEFDYQNINTFKFTQKVTFHLLNYTMHLYQVEGVVVTNMITNRLTI